MLLTVTQEDIDTGDRNGAPKSCAVALAFKRKLGHEVWVSSTYVYNLTPNGNAQICSFARLTPTIRRWITKFDRGETVKPHTFRI